MPIFERCGQSFGDPQTAAALAMAMRVDALCIEIQKSGRNPRDMHDMRMGMQERCDVLKKRIKNLGLDGPAIKSNAARLFDMRGLAEAGFVDRRECLRRT